ncbi:MAG: hypothetical protein RLZZ153_2448, partial [Pseudomonadota bacterium]
TIAIGSVAARANARGDLLPSLEVRFDVAARLSEHRSGT